MQIIYKKTFEKQLLNIVNYIAKDKINEPFAVINADDFYGKDSFIAIASYLMAIDEGIDNKFCSFFLGF